jgi:hypothetical protein
MDSMGARLMSDNDKKFCNLVAVTQPERYQNPISCSQDHGEGDLRELCVIFKMSFSTMNDFFRNVIVKLDASREMHTSRLNVYI